MVEIKRGEEGESGANERIESMQGEKIKRTTEKEK